MAPRGAPTRYAKRGYVFLGTATGATAIIWLRSCPTGLARLKRKGLANRRKQFERQLLIPLSNGKPEPATGIPVRPRLHASSQLAQAVDRLGHRLPLEAGPQIRQQVNDERLAPECRKGC